VPVLATRSTAIASGFTVNSLDNVRVPVKHLNIRQWMTPVMYFSERQLQVYGEKLREFMGTWEGAGSDFIVS
jgi:hypothetical protein